MKNTMDIKTRRSYLLLMLKKGMKLIPFFAVSAAFAAALILIASFVFSSVMGRSSILPKAEIAIVVTDGHLTPGENDTEELRDASPDLLTRMAVNLVAQMDSVSSLGEISFYTLEEADTALRSGAIDLAIYLSADTYDDINNGQNTPIVIRLASQSDAAQRTLFSSLISAGVRMIRTIEAAVYAPSLISGNYTLVSDAGSVGDRIFELCLQLGMNRNTLWNVHSLSAFGDLSAADFYLVSAMVLLLCLFGLGFSPFYTASDREIVRLLGRNRSERARLLLRKTGAVIFTVFIFSLPVCLLVLIGSGLLSGTFSVSAVFLSLLRFLPALLVTSCLLGSLVHLVGTLVSEKNRSIFYLLLVTALFVLTGGILPSAYQPEFLRAISVFSPTALAQKLLAQNLLGTISISTVFFALLEALLFLAASLAVDLNLENFRDLKITWRVSEEKKVKSHLFNSSSNAKTSSEKKDSSGRNIVHSLVIRESVIAKRHLKRPSFWLITALGISIFLLLSAVALPSASNTSIGLFAGNSETARVVTEDLTTSSSVYSYVSYNSLERLQNDVATGKLDCAFVFDESLEGAVSSGNIEKAVDVYTTSSTTKYLAAREEIFAALLGPLTDGILDRLSDQGKLFASSTEEAKTSVCEASAAIRNSDAVLSVYFEDITTGELTDVTQMVTSQDSRSGSGAAPQVLVLLIFASALFFAAFSYSAEERSILTVLRTPQRALLRFSGIWTPLLIFSMTLMIAAGLAGQLRGFSLLSVLAVLLIGIPATAIWTTAFSVLIKNETVYLFLITLLLILSALFLANTAMVSLGILTKQFLWLRYLLPTTWLERIFTL